MGWGITIILNPPRYRGQSKSADGASRAAKGVHVFAKPGLTYSTLHRFANSVDITLGVFSKLAKEFKADMESGNL